MTAVRYSPEIDGLRAIAVLAVVLYHADAALLPSGFVGVDVFFVISGYLITSLLAVEHERTGRIDLPAFWARRARRIVPALLAVVAAVSIASAALLSRHATFDEIAGSAVASLLFVANFWFQATSGGYFDAAAETKPLMHLWSLAVEEQFYLAYPLLLAAMLRWPPDRARRPVAVLAIASLLLAEYWVRTDAERAFFQMPARFWELAAGALVALSPARATRGLLDRLLVPGGTLLVLAACLYTRAWGVFPASGAVLAVAGTAIALIGIHRGALADPVAAALRWRPAVLVGLVSYSFYLWHWPLLVFEDRLRMDEGTLSWRLALCAIALALAWLSWRFVEQPVRRWRAGPQRVLAAAGLAIGACIIVALLAGRADGVPLEIRALAEKAHNDQAARLRCDLRSTETFDVEDLAECTSEFGRDPGIVIWGDSHATAWEPLASRLAAREKVPVASLTMDGCAPGWRGESRERVSARRPCAEMNAFVLRALSARPVDTLVVATRWPLGESVEALESRIAGLHAALPRLRDVRRIIVIGPLPKMRRPVPECIQLGMTSRCGMLREVFDETSAPVWDALEALANRYPNVQLVDPTPWFCNTRDCPAVSDGTARFRDLDHLTATAARDFSAAWMADPARYDRTHRAAAPREHP